MLIPDLIPSSCLHMSCKRILDIASWYSAGHRFTSLLRRILDWRIFLAVSAVVVVPPYPWSLVFSVHTHWLTHIHYTHTDARTHTHRHTQINQPSRQGTRRLLLCCPPWTHQESSQASELLRLETLQVSRQPVHPWPPPNFHIPPWRVWESSQCGEQHESTTS